jgi:hypothetical protein
MKVIFDVLTQEDWVSFHETHRGSLQQAWAYGEALDAMAVRVHRAMVVEGDEVVAIAQFICRRFVGYISLASCARGPVFAPHVSAEQRRAAYALLRQKIPLPRLRVVLFSPNVPLASLEPAEMKGLSRVMTGYSTVMLDLTRPLDALKAALEGKWRNRLSKALAHPQIRVQVQPSLKRCQWLLTKEQEQREAKKFHGLPTAFVEAYIAALPGKGQAFVVAYAELGKNTIAAMLFLIHGRVASYHMGWADEEGRQLNAHNLLMWKAMAHFQQQGIDALDLGGVNTHDLAGISRFKLGTGGQVLTLAGTYF